MKRVSIIIPAYNAEAYIAQCAASVLNQTIEEIEIIFVDDGSTDNTGEILDCIAKEHDNVLVIHHDNQGLYKSRQVGLSYATGEYIGWVDADDYVENDMYEVLYYTAIEYESELVICDYSWHPKKLHTKEKWFREYFGTVDVSFIERNTQPWNKIVKRVLIERLHIADYFVSCFDEIYALLLIEAKNPITIRKPLYHYRVGFGSMSSTYTNVDHYRGFVDASKALYKVIDSFNLDSYWNDYFKYRIVYYIIMTMIVAANAGNRKEYERYRKELFSMYPQYNKNQHFWNVLRENYGWMKAAIIGGIIPMNYEIAHLACRVGLGTNQ